MSEAIEEFLSSLPFDPDPFQREAIAALSRSIVVTAPTGSGKTLVAEAAIHLARANGRRVFYTTPIKALSNQKYNDLLGVHGEASVGLLTGDNVINGDAPIVVMTTEVLRNMIYAGAAGLQLVDFVILDEVHYLQDRFRGAVWEEVIIHAPQHIRLVCLSATIANADEFTGWVAERRGGAELILSTTRPVPLTTMYMLTDRSGEERLRIEPLFAVRDGEQRPNPRLDRMLSLQRGRKDRYGTPRRVEIVERLGSEGILPAIYFIFSRAGCDAAAVAIAESGTSFTSPGDRETTRRIAEARTAHLSDRDLDALGFGRWLATLETGAAAHHAGMVPAFKETVEELFSAGILKVVFATETLALGINMPARTVIIESLSKFDGEGHSLMEPGDFTQLTGRAGRRGIDVEGFGVVLHTRFVRFDQVTRIASVGSHPLRSSFRPTYNMAANLVANYDEMRARELLSASFAQFQRKEADQSSSRMLEELEVRWQDESVRAECDLGSVAEFVEVIDHTDTHRSRNLSGSLHPGDVLDVPGGPRSGRYVILRRVARGKKGLRFLVMGTSGRISTIGSSDVGSGSSRAGRVEFPRPFVPTDRKFQQVVLRRLRAIPASAARVGEKRPVTIDHPVAACPHAAEHIKWFRRSERTRRRLDQHLSKRREQGIGLLEDFESIRTILEQWDYLNEWNLTARGERLRFVYNEMDLLLTEAIERGVFWSLEARELAAVASLFVYEPRTDKPADPTWPSAIVEERYRLAVDLWEELAVTERKMKLPPTRRPEGGFAAAAFAWASSRDLDDLPTVEFAPGDFVRVSRQLVDLLRQLRDGFPELAEESREALRLVDRGVVAAQGVA